MRYAFLLWLMLTLSALAGAHWEGNCSIQFDVTATMHDFVGTVESEPFSVAISGKGDDRRLTWQTQVSPMKISTREKERDHEAQKTLRATEHPFLVGAVDGVTIASLSAEDAELPFVLTIAGVSKPTTAVITAWSQDDKALSFNASFDVSMKEFELKPKSMLGIIRVHDKVRATCHFSLKSSSDSP